MTIGDNRRERQVISHYLRTVQGLLLVRTLPTQGWSSMSIMRRTP
jgi:hypothetical protein